MTLNIAKAYDYAKKLVRLKEKQYLERGKYDEGVIIGYINALNNPLGHLLYMKKTKEALGIIHKLKALEKNPLVSRSEDLKWRLFYWYSRELTIYTTSGDFEKGIHAAESIKAGLNKYGEKLGTIMKLYIYSSLAFTYYGAGKYREALAWNIKVLDHPKKDTRKYFRVFALLFNTIIHIELKNFLMLPYLTRSIQHYLRKPDGGSILAAATLGFIRKKYLSTSKKGITPEYKEKLKKKLSASMLNPPERAALQYFDFVSWIESKIEDRSFAEIIKKRWITSKQN
jgi:tetratricopeptide (TPR) repeat protein